MSKKKKFVGVQFVETVRVGNDTFAFGIYADNKVGRVPFAGLAEKFPEDKENTIRGRNFAVGRAFENLGTEIQRREWKLMRSNNKKSQTEKLSDEEIKERIAKGKDVREARAKARKNAKESAKAGKSTDKTGTKGSKTK